MTRAEKVAEARKLRAQGLTIEEIAARLGVKRSSASAYLNDPDLAKQKARRRRYSRPCSSCGAMMDGSSGFNGRSSGNTGVCHRCLGDHMKVWKRAQIIEAIQRWAREHGRPPTAEEWIRSGPWWPANTTVYQDGEFDSWADAIEASGFPRPHWGKRLGDTTPNVSAALMEKLEMEGELSSIDATAVVDALRPELRGPRGGRRKASRLARRFFQWAMHMGYAERTAPGRYRATYALRRKPGRPKAA